MIIKNWFKRLYLQLALKGKKVTLCSKCKIKFGTIFEGMNVIGRNTIFSGYIGHGSYIGSNSRINAKIGRFCSIASDVKTINGFHPLNFLSTSPTFYSTEKRNNISFSNNNMFEEYKLLQSKYDVIIGNDVWIGEGVRILAGVKIGDGAIIGTGSLVTKDIPNFAIVVGVPSKVIRYRFDKDTIVFLNSFKWWDKDLVWLKNNANYFIGEFNKQNITE